MNEAISISLMVVASFLAALGQISLKIGSMKLEKSISKLIRNYALLVGISFYGISSIVSIVALRGNELTVLYPIASLNYVWVSLLSMKYLKEKMNALKWSGVILIILGVTIIL